MATLDPSHPPSLQLDALEIGTAPSVAPVVAESDDIPTTRHGGYALVAGLTLAASLVICLVGYLVLSVPARWFPSSSPVTWSGPELTIVRGTGTLLANQLLISAPDASGIILVSLNSNLRASDYAAIAWVAGDLPESADIQLLWRNDYQPSKLNATPVTLEARTLLPIVVAGNPAWVGRITGLALAMRGPLAQPFHISKVIAKPMGAFELLGDRFREWFVFEQWTGASINVVTGGADVQDLPLPPLLAVAGCLAAILLLALRRIRPHAAPVAISCTLIGLFIAAWFMLDARWMWNLARQVQLTALTYAGKTVNEKHQLDVDGPLFRFVEQARSVMPAKPVRVFVFAELRYYRERAAYLLYPHNAYTDRVYDRLPPASALHAGDWLFVYRRRGVQFDSAAHRLRWDNTESISADLITTGPGAALFAIR